MSHCSSIQLCQTLSDPMDSNFPYPSLSPGVCSNSCPLSWRCHPTISSSVAPFSCPQSFPAWASFRMSWLFTFNGQSIGASTSASVLPMNVQDWFPLGLTGLISRLTKALKSLLQHHSWKAPILILEMGKLRPREEKGCPQGPPSMPGPMTVATFSCFLLSWLCEFFIFVPSWHSAGQLREWAWVSQPSGFHHLLAV